MVGFKYVVFTLCQGSVCSETRPMKFYDDAAGPDAFMKALLKEKADDYTWTWKYVEAPK